MEQTYFLRGKHALKSKKMTLCFSKVCVMALNFFSSIFSQSRRQPPGDGIGAKQKRKIFSMKNTSDLSQYETEKKYRARLLDNSMTVTFFSFLNRKSSNTDFLWWCAYIKVVWISVCQFIHFPLLHCFLSSGRNTAGYLRVYLESLVITRLTEFGWNSKGERFLQTVWSGVLHSTFLACFEQGSRIYTYFN